jgi:starch synthase
MVPSDTNVPSSVREERLRVLFVAAEAAPLAKVGGLAEFTVALPKALRSLGVDARLIIPRYGDRHDVVPLRAEVKARKVGSSLEVPVGSGSEPAQLLETSVDGVPVYLIHNDQHFGNRERVYGFNDDPQRFVYFSRAVIAAIQALAQRPDDAWIPDILHANDWHTAPVTAWLDVYGRWNAPRAPQSRANAQPFASTLYGDIASLFTIHNVAYQGLSGRLLLTFGQMMDLPHLPVEPPGKVNWLAQGIAHADLVTTVSPTHARELLYGAETAGDLRPLFEERSDRIFGILSGIDTELWDPSTDEALAQTFDLTSLKMRSVNKTALQRELRLPTDLDVPLIGVVSRLDPLKGLDLLFDAVEELLVSRELCLVLLGTGDEGLAEKAQALQMRHPQSVRALIRFDERLARRIYGGVDLFVLPSEYEPVSVGVMTAMRYGAVPLVHAVGGLADTVVDSDAARGHHGTDERGSGFSFTEFTARALAEALERALSAYSDEARWVGLQRRAMSRDFSWRISARAYLDLYERARLLKRSGSRD